MEEKQTVHSQPARFARLTTLRQTLDKKQWAIIGSVVVTLSALAVIGVRKGLPWYLAHK